MTTRELMDSLYETLMWDERILSARERELLVGVLQRAQSHANGSESTVKRTIAQSVGETIAQRAYEALGETITRRLLEKQQPFYVEGSQSLYGADGSVSQNAVASRTTRWVSLGPPPVSPGPHPPGPPSAQVRSRQSSVAAVADRPNKLHADCVIFDEFLAPAEMEFLLRYAIEQESDFQISEVIQPGAAAGIIDYDQRRSRVLMELGVHGKLIEDRIRECVPRVLARLGHQAFELSSIEAQITASNDGDYFHRHADNAQTDSASREITFVYFLHREPKRFQGGELRIYDSRGENDNHGFAENFRSVVPRQNQIVFFASSLPHEITPIECASREFGDSRFTVNGWLRR